MSQTVKRAIEIMRLVSTGPRGLDEIAAALGTHKSTAMRLAHTLVDEGLARRTPDGRYTIGLAVVPLAQRALDLLDVRTVARPHLERIRHETGHTTHLAQFFDPELIYIDKIDGDGTVAMGSKVGLPPEVHTAAVAKVILAHQSQAVIARTLELACFVSHTRTTITSPAQLTAEFNQIRARGWAEDNGEQEDYIACVAVPIWSGTGQVVAGMSITALRVVEPLSRLRLRVPTLTKVAGDISKELGWQV